MSHVAIRKAATTAVVALAVVVGMSTFAWAKRRDLTNQPSGDNTYQQKAKLRLVLTDVTDPNKSKRDLLNGDYEVFWYDGAKWTSLGKKTFNGGDASFEITKDEYGSLTDVYVEVP